jgi:site-specific recombinase XerD
MEPINRPRKIKQIPHLVELETLQALFDTLRAEETVMAHRDYALLLLMFDTGLRRAEAVSLWISDVNMKTGKIIVRKGKNSNQRKVPCKAPVLEVVQTWLDVHPNKEGKQLFVALRGKNKNRGLSPGTVNGIVKHWINKAEVENPEQVTPHALRRAFATYFSDTGGDMFALRDILGHKSIETTRAYVINTAGRLQKQHEKHSPINLLSLGSEQIEMEQDFLAL